MKEIQLTRGMVALVDDEDYPDLSQFRWAAYRGTNTVYAQRYVNLDGKYTTMLMHRQILDAKPGEQVDRKNHNGLDCRRENIRKCTTSQNHANRRKRIGGSSAFKGVAWDESRRLWQAVIQLDRKSVWLGRFTDEQTAARAYDAAAKRMFGEFALLNFR